MPLYPDDQIKFIFINSDPVNHVIWHPSFSVSIKNATFGMKRSFLQEYIQVHNTFCYVCSKPPLFSWLTLERGRQRCTEREKRVGGVGGLHNVRSADGSTSIAILPNLHNQVCCFQPCFQLSHTEGNLLALILGSLEITRHDESSEWFS